MGVVVTWPDEGPSETMMAELVVTTWTPTEVVTMVTVVALPSAGRASELSELSDEATVSAAPLTGLVGDERED
jgi:hypothetical protein